MFLRKIKAVCLLCLFFLPFSSSYCMTLEEKIGQLLMVHFLGDEVNDEAKALIEKVRIGGVIYYNWANTLSSPHQVLLLSKGLQKLAKESHLPPLLIAVDQEGGGVAHLTKGFTVFPGNAALGMTKAVPFAEDSAAVLGKELKAVGINMNLAPVVDINSNPRNPIIGVRSFGKNPIQVCTFAKAALKGYQRAQILTSLKHFPGHGDVEKDSHEDLPVLYKTLEELQKGELYPFSQLADYADSVMIAHLKVPSIDPDKPATCSKKILDILREEIGFQGVVISDSLAMEGFLKSCSSIEEGALSALQAGCDILLLGGRQIQGGNLAYEISLADVERIHKFLVEAVKSGLLSEDHIDRSVERVLTMKSIYKLGAEETNLICTSESQGLARKIALTSLQIVQNNPIFYSSKKGIFFPGMIRDLLPKKEGESSFCFFTTNPTEEEKKVIEKVAEESDLLIFCSYNAWKYSSQLKIIRFLTEMGKPFVLITLRDPFDSELVTGADVVINTFSPTEPSIRAAFEQLDLILSLKRESIPVTIGYP